MDRIPTELLSKIFIQLNLQQRLVCLTVCQRWWNILDSCNLFYNVNMAENDARFKRMMAIFEQSPNYAAQVEELDIKINVNGDFNRTTILKVFPNARVIRVSRISTLQKSSPCRFKHPIAPTGLKSKVEVLSDFNHCELVSEMLNLNLGGRLKTLCLRFEKLTDTPTILSQLRDMPVLKMLSLWLPEITILDLEEIHKNLPSVQNLALDYITMDFSSMPTDIIPATSITKLRSYYSRFKNADAHAQFYQYLTKKYTNITEIEHEDTWLYRYSADERRDIYLNGMLDFLKLTGPLQSELTLYALPDNVDPFEALDAVDSKVKKLDFLHCDGKTGFHYLSQSKQTNYVEEINIKTTATHSFHFLQNMTALSTLSIHLRDSRFPPVYMDKLLSSCPVTLKTLVISCDDMVTEPLVNNLTCIETLDIQCDTLTDGIGNLISSCFPKLTNLYLSGQVKENVNMTLRNPHLQDAAIFILDYRQGEFKGYGLSFQSLTQNETKYYHLLYEEGKRTQYRDIQHLPILSVNCYSSYTLDPLDCIKVYKIY